MNCKEFDVIVLDLVRGNLKIASARREGMAHASNCRVCAERFSQERILSAGLRAWAESSSRGQAPTRLEAALLAAFRAHAPLRAAHRVRETRPARLWFAAAGILIFLAATLAFLENSSVRGPSPPLPSATRKLPAGPVEAAAQIELKSEERNFRETPLRRLTAQPKRRMAPRAGVSIAPNRVEEITTGFIPLPYGSNLNLWEDGPSSKIHLIRMRLPRSALVTTGLPMNEERANEPVLADVLFTEDGLARGIRFIN